MKRFLNWAQFGHPEQGIGFRCFILAACVIVGGVFILAALPKIKDPGAFALSIFHYQAIPDKQLNAVALILPWLELLCGVVFIFLPSFRMASGYLLVMMLISFTGLQVCTIYRGINISCGCLSVNQESGHLGWLSVARNVALITLTAVAVWGFHGKKIPAHSSSA